MPTITLVHDRYLDHSEPLYPICGYDGTEVHPVRNIAPPGDPLGTQYETCEPADAELWSTYLHHPRFGLDCVGDFTLPADAEAYAAELDKTHGWKS